MPGFRIFVIGFNHGWPCYVKNMAQGTQTKTEAWAEVFGVTEARGMGKMATSMLW